MSEQTTANSLAELKNLVQGTPAEATRSSWASLARK